MLRNRWYIFTRNDWYTFARNQWYTFPGILTYEGALLIGALGEFIEMMNQDSTGDLINHLQLFQKRLKYGLPTDNSIILHEFGFSDRVIAQELATVIVGTDRISVKKSLCEKKVDVERVLSKYPRYFTDEVYGNFI